MEKNLKEKSDIEKKEIIEQMEGAKSRADQAENVEKEMSRKMITVESEFKKEKALLE